MTPHPKTYSFIVLNKDNMKEIQHFKTRQQVSDFLFDKNYRHFLVIKNEKTVIDWKEMEGVGGSPILINQKLREVIDKQ